MGWLLMSDNFIQEMLKVDNRALSLIGWLGSIADDSGEARFTIREAERATGIPNTSIRRMLCKINCLYEVGTKTAQKRHTSWHTVSLVNKGIDGDCGTEVGTKTAQKRHTDRELIYINNINILSEVILNNYGLYEVNNNLSNTSMKSNSQEATLLDHKNKNIYMQTQEQAYPSEISPTELKTKSQMLQFITDEWNQAVNGTAINPIKKLTDGTQRVTNLNARVKQYSVDEVVKTIRKIPQSDFLCGRATDFVVTFDWFVKPNNFEKIYNGNYDNKPISNRYNGNSDNHNTEPIETPEEYEARIKREMYGL